MLFLKNPLRNMMFLKKPVKSIFFSQKSSEKYFLFPKNPPKNFLFFSKKNPSNSCATLRIVSFRLNSCFFRQALIVDKCRFLQRCLYHRSNFMWGHWCWYVLHQHLKIFCRLFCGSTGVDMFFINRSVKEGRKKNGYFTVSLAVSVFPPPHTVSFLSFF